MSARRPAVAGWLLASTVYFLAVLHRSSLGVAGLIAQRRFGIDPAQLSLFVFLQIGVYAAMQVPTGVLVDRYGPRRVLVAAATIMGTAQLVFATVDSFPLALAARALLGCGDALTFVSVLRYAATHFSPHRYPVLVALTGMIGTVGNVVATLPLALALNHLGWGPSLAAAGSLSLLSALAVGLLLRDASPLPPALRTAAALRAGVGSVWRRVRISWSLPGTRLGFWVHFTSMSTGTALGVLWGSPYLQKVCGLSPAGAGAVLMTCVLSAAVVSPVNGWVIGRHPSARVPIVLAVSGAIVAGVLVLVTAFGDRPPTGYVVALFVLATLGGPASMTAFALARDYNGARTLGTASGVVNVGGFVATVLIALGIGWVLDAQGRTDAHTLRWAMVVAVAIQGAGLTRTTLWWLRVRAHVLERQSRGEDVPVPVIRRAFDLRPALRATSALGEGAPVE